MDADKDESALRIEALETALRLREEQLAHSKDEFVKFASIIAHDLRSPLLTISGYCDLLRYEYRGRLDESADRYLRAVVEGVARLNHLIGDLLGYAQIQPFEQPTETVRLDQVLADVVANLEGTIRDNHATLQIGELPRIRGSRASLVHLFQNLVDNAIKFHGEKPPEVRVSSVSDGSGHVVRVADNGIGIEPEHHEAVFQILHRLPKSRHLPGSGIGLAICKKIVESHEGRIWIESAPGQGTTFLVWLPGGE
ncbi:MAG: hypothetical protein JW719_09850 [Pirellulales bacterium]|nr:hypothetical protein [Pirellulales bacterium]